MQYLGLLVVLAGCGRIAFEPVADTPPAAHACGPAYAAQPGLTSTYRIVSARRTWHAAEADCESDGGHLPVVESMTENAWLLATIADDTWLGMSDHVSNGTFQWVTGAPLAFAPWDMAEPNDQNGDEDCGQLYMGGRWNDNVCDLRMSYACECDERPALTPPTYCDTDADPQNCGSCGTVCASGSCTDQRCD